MEIGNNNSAENSGKIISVFKVSSDADEALNGQLVQSEFSFTDGFNDDFGEDIECIEMLKDVEPASDSNKRVIADEWKEDSINKNFKEYITICSEMGLIPTWRDLDNFNKFQNNS